MTWASHHSESERLASEAEVVARARGAAAAEDLYRRAAEAEERALNDLDVHKQRTLGITAVSATALFYKAHEYARAQHLAHTWLATRYLPAFACDQLQDILINLWSREEQERVGLHFLEGDVLVSVKGGMIVRGGAPLDLIVSKVKEVQAFFFRTIEMLLDQPLRRRGDPSQEVQGYCRPWLFQAPPGSYQFAVRVQEPPQGDLFAAQRPKIEQVATTFLEIVRASAIDPESLSTVVPDAGYRDVFLKLARNLAPTGKSYEQIDIRDAARPDARTVTMVSNTRDAVNQAIRKARPPRPTSPAGAVERRLAGVLRAVHLDQDWLEIALDERGGSHVRVHEAGEALDDVIGPMVNRRVLMDVVQTGERFSFRDIQAEE
ncbi:MAG: hypothetical protein IT355_13250 [Gemmatimonadaceae bacterium]|nr:hypothetical protein [Gemmatimonadaceae bacterium]